MENNFIFEEHKVFDKAEDFLDFFLPWKNDLRNYVFRGHSDSSYQLIPSVLREDNFEKIRKISNLSVGSPAMKNTLYEQIIIEKSILREFYKTADSRGLFVPISKEIRNALSQEIDYRNSMKGGDWIDNNLIEIASLAQHYGLPTRLLDWTYDPFIAIFFAVQSAVKTKTDIDIWCINKERILMLENSNEETPLKFYTPHYQNNVNIIAQKGLFSYWKIKLKANFFPDKYAIVPIDRRSINQLLNEYVNENKINTYENIFKKVSFKKEGLDQLWDNLRMLGYKQSKIYPDYKGVVNEMYDREFYHNHNC